MDALLHKLKRLQGEIASIDPQSGNVLNALDLQQQLTDLRQSLVDERYQVGLKLDAGRLRRRALNAYQEIAK